MIIELVMNLLKSLILFVIGLLPKLPPADEILGYISGFLSLVQGVDQFISVKLVGVCFVLILLFYNIRAVWSVIMWVIRKIPTIE